MEHKSNKTIVLEFYKQVVGERKSELIDNYVSDHYIQHSPSLKSSKAGLLEALEFLKQLPRPKENKSPIIHAIEDGDYVMTYLDFEFLGNWKNVIDIFRLEQGRVVEHWDAVQDIRGVRSTQILPYETGVRSRSAKLTDNNKLLVQRFFDGAGRTQNKFLSKDYTEHNSEIWRMTGRLDIYLDRAIRSTTKVHRILGENNFVVVQSEGTKSSRPFVFYDLFNVLDNTIVEHWSVEQEIPDVMPHDNGML